MSKKGGNKPQTLSANDMTRIAREQSDIARQYLGEQTTANRPEQVTPFGSSIWEDLGDNRWRQTVSLTDDLQRAADAQQSLAAERSELAGDLFGTAAEDLNQPITWDAMTANEVSGGDAARQSAEDAIYGRSASRLDPMWNQREEATRTRLWNQGLRPGDAAWDTAMGNMERARTDAYQTAMSEAIMGGGKEASRVFEMDMSRRQQALAEQLRRRTQALGEVGAVSGGRQVGMPQLPGFSQAGRASPPDLLGAAQMGHENEWTKYSARSGEKQAQYQGMMDAVSTFGPMIAAAFMSDRRLKSNIVHVGFTPGGQRVYEYDIFGTRQRGVMADESPPEAVLRHPSGYLMVDYSRIK